MKEENMFASGTGNSPSQLAGFEWIGGPRAW